MPDRVAQAFLNDAESDRIERSINRIFGYIHLEAHVGPSGFPECDEIVDRASKAEVKKRAWREATQHVPQMLLHMANGIGYRIRARADLVAGARLEKLPYHRGVRIDRKKKWRDLVVQIARKLCALLLLQA